MSVVLYEYEIWSFILRKEREVKLSENRVPRRIFGPKRDEVAGEWSKLHNEELYDLHRLSNIIWIIKDRIEKN